ncbi:hypothetical protein V2G26_021290 [Clonostachys chloroleuca]
MVADSNWPLASPSLVLGWQCEDGRPADCPNSDGTQSPILRRKGGRSRPEAALNPSFTPEEEELLIKLKEGKEGLKWAAIHKKFSEQYSTAHIWLPSFQSLCYFRGLLHTLAGT